MATGCGNSMAGDGDESMQLMRSPGLHLAPGEAPIDLLAATRAVTDLLTALGQNPQSAHLVDTPRRVADAFAAMLTPAPFTLTTFPNEERYDELVLARDIPFTSLCEHHLLPFTGVAHVGYLPAERVVGLSKLARRVECLPAGCRSRNASANRSPAGCTSSFDRAVWAWYSKPNTSA